MSDTMNQGGSQQGSQGGDNGGQQFVPDIELSQDGKTVNWKRAPDDIRVIPRDKVHSFFEKATGYDSLAQKRKAELKEWEPKGKKLQTYDALFGDEVLNTLGKLKPDEADAAIRRMKAVMAGKPEAKEADPFAALFGDDDANKPKPLTEEDYREKFTKDFEGEYSRRRDAERRQDAIESELNAAFDEMGVPKAFRGDVRDTALKAAISENNPEKALKDYITERVAVAEKAIDEMREARKAKEAKAHSDAAPNITGSGVPARAKKGGALDDPKVRMGSPEWRQAAKEYAESLGLGK